jgi:uncharacterized membrane protein
MEEIRQTNQDQTSILKKWLTSEVKFIVVVVGIVWAFAGVYYPIKTDIALIKDNHMAHMESYSKELVRLSEVQTKQQEEIVALMTTVARLSK